MINNQQKSGRRSKFDIKKIFELKFTKGILKFVFARGIKIGIIKKNNTARPRNDFKY